METKTKLSFQKLLDKTKRNQYTNKELVAEIEPCEPQELEFFTLGRYVSDHALEAEYTSRDLTPAHPYALALYSLEHEAEMDEKRWVATHWKNAKGQWCFAAFDRWDDVERGVGVGVRGGEWGGGWWFAGLRKSSALRPSELSAPLSLDLESALKIVKKAGLVVYHPL